MKERNFTYGKHQINEVLVLNLESRPDRKWAAIGALTLAQCPFDRIRIWNAVPASDFEDDIEKIGEAAVADGFPWFAEYCKIRRFMEPPMMVAQAWSYCQMLRHLADNDLTGLILYDDRYILDFEQLSAINYWLMQGSLQNENEPYLILQLEHYENTRHHIGYEWKLHRQFPYLAEGPLGASENAMLYPPQGAKYALEFLEANLTKKHEQSGINIETALVTMSHLPPEERRGIWTVYNLQVVYHNENFGSDRLGTAPKEIKKGGC